MIELKLYLIDGDIIIVYDTSTANKKEKMRILEL